MTTLACEELNGTSLNNHACTSPTWTPQKGFRAFITVFFNRTIPQQGSSLQAIYTWVVWRPLSAELREYYIIATAMLIVQCILGQHFVR